MLLYIPIVRHSYILACIIIFGSCSYTKGPPEPIVVVQMPPDEIIYTDTLDLQVAPGASATLDVNSDQIPDIMIYGIKSTYIMSSGSSGAHYSSLREVRSMNGNCRISAGIRNEKGYANFFTGTPISENSVWSQKLTLYSNYLTDFYGCWVFPNEGYIGLELSQAQAKRYAWIKLEQINDLQVVSRSAINRTPGNPIKAGQKK